MGTAGKLEGQRWPRPAAQEPHSGPRASAEPASHGAVAQERQPGVVAGSHVRLPLPSANALALALASPAARQVGLRDWLRQCHGHRQRSSSSGVIVSGRCQRQRPPMPTMRPHSLVIGHSEGPLEARSPRNLEKQQHVVACEHAIIAQAHNGTEAFPSPSRLRPAVAEPIC
jgi:hypothetical protein